MKYSIVSLLLTATIIATLHAETPSEREFKQLRDQRDKAVAAAIEPINRRYQSSLDQLLRRATQANDLETALKIKQEMGTPLDPKMGTEPKKDPTGMTIVFGAYSWQFLPDNKVIKTKAPDTRIETDYTVTSDGRISVQADVFAIKSKTKALLWKGPDLKPIEVEVRKTQP